MTPLRGFAVRALVAGWALGACSPAAPLVEAHPEPTGDTSPEFEAAHLFTFALLADPHIWGAAEHTARLEHAVSWLNEQAEPRRIELSFVLGDITWGRGVEEGVAALDALQMPYIPVLGDNEIQTGEEADWEGWWEHRFAALPGEVHGFSKAHTPVWHPGLEVDAWFQNFRFEHRGVWFFNLDWAIREFGFLRGEMADLHDVPGGTFPWLRDALAAVPTEAEGSVVLMSHHPMHLSPGGFDLVQLDQVTSLLDAHAPKVRASFAGHYHINYTEWIEAGGYEVVVTDAVFERGLTVRLVEVWTTPEGYALVQEEVVLPWPPEAD